MPILEELITSEEFETIADLILEAFLQTIPNLELVTDDNMLIWLIATIQTIPKPSNGIKLSKVPENVWELLDRPNILQFVKEKIVPSIKQKTREIEATYIFFSEVNKICNVISTLNVEDHPSKRIKEFVETEQIFVLSDSNIKETEGSD